MELRECMISLMAAARRRTELPEGTEEPQAANVKAWSELLFNHCCPGSSNDKMRGYLKATTDKAWDLVNHLTHHRNANRTGALIAKRAVDTIVVHMANILTRDLWERTDQCPRCESRSVRTFYDPEIAPDGGHFESCGECDWNSHPGLDVVDFDGIDPLAPCEAQLEAVRGVHESWVRNGNESMIAFTANSIAALEEQIRKLLEETRRRPQFAEHQPPTPTRFDQVGVDTRRPELVAAWRRAVGSRESHLYSNGIETPRIRQDNACGARPGRGVSVLPYTACLESLWLGHCCRRVVGRPREWSACHSGVSRRVVAAAELDTICSVAVWPWWAYLVR